MIDANSPDAIRDSVRDSYGAIANGGCCGPDANGGTAGCCAPAADPDALAQAIGYSREELENLPADANLGLSCGNPAAVASLVPGEAVVDLGSGAGFDAFLCGPKVGATGSVIGVDMTPQMLSKARTNAGSYTQRTGLNNVEFRLGEIEHLPVADNSVDVIISNCVINLSAQKDQVIREAFRVLRPGGRFAVSDMALFQRLPQSVMDRVEAWIGCVAGAISLEEYQTLLDDAGFVNAQLIPDPSYVETLCQGEDVFYQQIQELLPEGTSPRDYVTSLKVVAVKPDAQTSNR